MSQGSFSKWIAWGSCLLLALALPTAAHDGPEHEIEELTERLAAEGDSADLLLQRAIEFKVLGKLSEAIEDLERSLELDSGSALAHRELSKNCLAIGKPEEALRAANRGLGLRLPSADHASLLAVRAEILGARGKRRDALRDLDEAIKLLPANVEWYLSRSQLHARLNLRTSRIRGLEQGIEATGGSVLIAEWVDALIADGQNTKALITVEKELSDSRCQSFWLIRRAQIRQAARDAKGASADLTTALEELAGRIHPVSPDPQLLAERGLAQELLGNKEAARKDYEAAREKGVLDEWVRGRLSTITRSEIAN